MTALSKAEITNSIISELDFERKEARQVVDCFFEAISDLLVKSQDVKLSGFGNFIVRTKKERPGRNPKTGELVMVSARRVVTFKPGLKLKKLVQ